MTKTSADKLAAIAIWRHTGLEALTIFAAVHNWSVDVEVLADTSATAIANVVNDSIFVLVAREFGAEAAANHAENVQLFQAMTELLASKEVTGHDGD